MNSNKIKILLIIEVLGRPPEHLTETLESIIKNISNEKGVSVLNKKINEPKLIKDRNDFYTSFAEIEIEVDDILGLVPIMFKYMPSHIEVISPGNIIISNSILNNLFNELAGKLHQYDEVARVLQVEKKILEKKLRELMPLDKKEDKESR
ncbi:MAG TPA: hypothetical protein VJH65_01360 [Candidatus Nanoarchaeia archaeon]|nr:hypothetical protein [Candidatus Nanoarchaeia archaeon]